MSETAKRNEKEEPAGGDHLKLLCDFGELNWIFAGSRNIDSFLHKIGIILLSIFPEFEVLIILVTNYIKEQVL